MPGLPLPQPDDETRPFWEFCAKGELRVQRCLACGRLRYPPRPACPNCAAFEHEWQQLSGHGAVFSYVVSHQAVHPALTDLLPHAVVLIELDEGVRMTSNLVDCPVDEIAIGLPVEVVFERVSDEIVLPKFRRV